MIFADILNDINSNWSITEKARRIYTKVAKEIIYDDRFSFSTDKELLTRIYNRQIDIDRDESNVMVCKPANTMYMNLLHREGIKAELIYKPSSINRAIEVPDVSCIFYDENNNPVYTNIIGDLANCKYGLCTNYFGINQTSYENTDSFTVLGKDELEKIDRKTNYVKIDYSDLVFKLIVGEVKNTNNFKRFLENQGIDTKEMDREEILKNKIQYITKLIQFRNINAGSFERKQLYKKLFSGSVLDKFESKKFKAYEFSKPNGEDIEYISCIKLMLSEGDVFFIYSNEDEKYTPINKEELQNKIKGYKETHGKSIEENSNENNR